MTLAQELARFATGASFSQLSEAALGALKIRVLDSVGCALGALDAEPVGLVRKHLRAFGGAPLCRLIGGGAAPPDRAALYNGALVRYLDFNDSYLAPGETCHPSDNLAPVLAAADHARADGRTLLTALAVAYQVQCRLSDEAPLRERGFDHVTQGSYAVAAGVSRALGMHAERAADAVAIAGTAFNALRVTRTGSLSHWKGLAYPNTAMAGVHAAYLARSGITGPAEVFEGTKGFMESVAGRFEIDWAAEGLERVTRTATKRFDAEIHSQAAIEGLLELRAERPAAGEEVAAIELDTFDVAYDIIGGGAEGGKTDVSRKEEADHSLPYLLAVAWLDGDVLPAQYRSERIGRGDYQGFVTRPATWEQTREKFDALAAPHTTQRQRDAIASTVADLDHARVATLSSLLAGGERL